MLETKRLLLRHWKKIITSHLHFTPLKETDFPRLLQWLEQPHVKAWWDQEIHYTPEKVQQNLAALDFYIGDTEFLKKD